MRKQVRDLSRQYVKVIEWSQKDRCYVGSAPPIIGHTCHGPAEIGVMRQLTTIVDEWVEIFRKEGLPLPEPTTGKNYSGKFVVRVDPSIHNRAALKAMARNESLNQFVAAALAKA